MQEIEILLELQESFEMALAKLSGFKFIGLKQTIDIYYYDPLREDLKLNAAGKLMACCRLREKAGKYFLTYKTDHYKGDQWLYSDEYETEISDHEAAKSIISHLGLKELVTINSAKHIFETEKYEIVLENVDNLGGFLEVEYKGSSEDVTDIKDDIMTFINSLDIRVGRELNSGKPELLLNKQAIT